MPATLAPLFNAQFFAADGTLAAGYFLYHFTTGTSVDKDVYTDQSAGTTHPQPIVLDAQGRCELWLEGDGSEYAFELRTPADALVERWDDVGGVPVPNATAYVPLAGGVTMTGSFELSGPATSALEPVTYDQMTDADTAIQAALASTITAAMPIGAVIGWAVSALPSGYLALEGGNVSRTTYADLFALWGTTYGAGDGSTTFGLPDTRGYFLRGWDNGRGVDSGRALGSFQDDAIESHKHEDLIIAGSDADNGDPGTLCVTAATLGNGPQTITPSETGLTGAAAETRPLNFSVRFIVRAL